MSEITSSNIQDEKPKKKTYTQAQKEAIYRYRQKKGTSYFQCQKKAIYKYDAKIREYAKKYKDLIDNGMIEKLEHLDIYKIQS